MGWKSCQIYKKKNLNEMLIFYLSLLLYQAKIHSQAFYTIIDDDAYSIESIESHKKISRQKKI